MILIVFKKQIKNIENVMHYVKIKIYLTLGGCHEKDIVNWPINHYGFVFSFM